MFEPYMAAEQRERRPNLAIVVRYLALEVVLDHDLGIGGILELHTKYPAIMSLIQLEQHQALDSLCFAGHQQT